MKQDIILAGVGGQGILSIAFVIDNAALEQGLHFKQAEVHGMAQRGGAVQSHLRLSSETIYSDLIPEGKADMILSVEPLESLRYLRYLASDGLLVTSLSPFVNIPDYPDEEDLRSRIRDIAGSVAVKASELAREAGLSRSENMVMLGAASPFLIIELDLLRRFIEVLFSRRGDKVVDVNLRAFELGRRAAETKDA